MSKPISTTIDLNKLFPIAEDGSQSPLPKQEEFLKAVLDPNGPRNVAYFGGYGSGKSLILVIANIIHGILHGGDHVIARHYMPELRRTTMKLFHELLPPEFIIEKKDAVAETRIRSAKGVATFYFVGLDEPEKLDSLNLSLVSIDEASQTTEEAFLKLKGRLRNPKGLRKTLLVGNPKGHDYIYKYFIDKRCFKDLMDPRSKQILTAESQRNQYKLIVAPSTENKHLDPTYIQDMLATYSPERIKRDIEGNFDSFEGQVYTDFDRGTHVVRPFRIPHDWERHIRIDHGFRNPCSVGFYAISPDGEVYRYKELYVREWLVKEIICGNKREGKKGILDLIQGHGSFKTAKIDPSVRNRSGTTGDSPLDEYRRWWPESLPPLQLAKNDKQLGIDRVKSFLKVHPKSLKPSFYVFDTCEHFIEEVTTYRYPDMKANESGTKPEKEEPVKANDHAMDEWRYMLVDLPAPYTLDTKEDRSKKYTNIEIAMQDEIRRLKAPKEQKDPWGD